MRFFHLSDLHIGKQLHHYNLKEDQEAVLAEVVDYAKKLRPDAIVIAGDIYDKTVPSAEAVTVFDHFLTELSEITPAIPLLIISGNHDSRSVWNLQERFLSGITFILPEARRKCRTILSKRLCSKIPMER